MKKFINKLEIIIAIILIIYYLAINIISSNRIAFSEVFLFAGLLLLIYSFITHRYNKYKLIKRLEKIVNIVVIIGIIFFVSIQAILISFPKNSEKDADYIIVLGAGLKDGTKVSLLLRDRLDAALRCTNEYNNKGYIVVSGGQGTDEKIAEAEAMRNYLINHGVSKERILLEDKSTSTDENLKFSKRIIEKHSGKSIKQSSIKIITTDFHSFRSNLLAKRNGYGKITIYSSKTIYYLIPACYTREVFALVNTIILD